MEEKNKLIISYIDNKINELSSLGMFVPKDNAEELKMAFLNRNEDINIIKTRIDTIFNNSVNAYKENLDKIGSPYNDIIKVYEKIVSMNKVKTPIYLAGGIIPYVLLNEDSERKHSNLDLLCKKDDAKIVREIFRNNKLYEPKRDSLTYTIDGTDYGFEVVIDNIKVDIALYEETENGITEYSFDLKSRIGRKKNISVKLNDYIKPYVSSDNKKYTTLSLEQLIVKKLVMGRDKDKKDIEKIKECGGISDDKIKSISIPLVKETKLVGDNLEYTSTMPRIKLDIPKKNNEKGFINIATILLLIAIVVCFILGAR